MPIRIDEFSAAAQLDGTFTKAEQVRFLTVGFDVTLVFIVAQKGKPPIISSTEFDGIPILATAEADGVPVLADGMIIKLPDITSITREPNPDIINILARVTPRMVIGDENV